MESTQVLRGTWISHIYWTFEPKASAILSAQNLQNPLVPALLTTTQSRTLSSQHCLPASGTETGASSLGQRGLNFWKVLCCYRRDLQNWNTLINEAGDTLFQFLAICRQTGTLRTLRCLPGLLEPEGLGDICHRPPSPWLFKNWPNKISQRVYVQFNVQCTGKTIRKFSGLKMVVRESYFYYFYFQIVYSNEWELKMKPRLEGRKEGTERGREGNQHFSFPKAGSLCSDFFMFHRRCLFLLDVDICWIEPYVQVESRAICKNIGDAPPHR